MCPGLRSPLLLHVHTLQLAKKQGNVFATDAILATIMCCTRSSYSWDIVVQKVGNKLFFDKRDNSDFGKDYFEAKQDYQVVTLNYSGILCMKCNDELML